MIKNWNNTGKIKAIILGVLALPNLFLPFDGQEYNDLVIIFMPFIFACLTIPLILLFNKKFFKREIREPKWNDNPLNLKYPLNFFHFGAFFIIIIGLSLLLGSVIKFQTINYFGLFSISFGIGIFAGQLIILNWKKLRISYFIIGGIGFLIFIIYSFMFLIRSYTKDEDIIKHFIESYDKYTITAENIIDEFDNIELIEDINYSISIYDENIDYSILKDYIYRVKTIPIENKLKLNALFDTINCSSLNLVKDKYYRFKTDIRNWDLNHIYLVKILDDRILIDQYLDWQILGEGDFPKANQNWLFHLKGNWYFESKTQLSINNKDDYPYESDLSTRYKYYNNKNLESVGREFNDEKNGNPNYLKHGKWLYLDSNEYIIKEEIYCYGSLKIEKNYEMIERKKIEIDSTSTRTLENGKWVLTKEYIIE